MKILIFRTSLFIVQDPRFARIVIKDLMDRSQIKTNVLCVLNIFVIKKENVMVNYNFII